MEKTSHCHCCSVPHDPTQPTPFLRVATSPTNEFRSLFAGIAMVEQNTIFGIQLKWVSLLTLVVQNR
jgi:hypothetical protein